MKRISEIRNQKSEIVLEVWQGLRVQRVSFYYCLKITVPKYIHISLIGKIAIRTKLAFFSISL